jgi:urease accessory protein
VAVPAGLSSRALSAVAPLAFARGHAHGVEMPESASRLLCGPGLVATAAALHRRGIGIGAWLASHSPKVTCWLGRAVVAAGVGRLAWRSVDEAAV